jgi:hypothetical protein
MARRVEPQSSDGALVAHERTEFHSATDVENSDFLVRSS